MNPATNSQEAIISFMNWWQGLILGVLQGLTEYLPVSSSGHLAITELMFGLQMPVSVDVLLHLATLIPTVWIFRQKIGSLLCSLWIILRNSLALLSRRKDFNELSPKVRADGRYIAIVLWITLFTFIVAYPQKDLQLKFQPLLIAGAFLFTAFFLLLQHLLPEKSAFENGSSILQAASGKKALLLSALIGLAQGIAALPGVSRSGMTISVALLIGLKRREAGELSFIISIPVIAGALLLDSKELLGILSLVQEARGDALFSVALAFASACGAGFIALRLLLNVLDKGKFYFFSIYLTLISAFTFFYFYSN